ncbi:MAG: type II secretion system F family protein [Blautia sp.]|nr:type II secretion system F family protein [Blautia sp.]MDD7730171.1 type II secretion system F family protein [Clostridia bacterium]MDY5664878.1 type II secretion system F family protein [Blautia sp.]
MWLHIVIFIIILLVTAGWKTGWIPVEGFGDADSRRLFVIVALAGNVMGLVLTFTDGGGQVYSEGYGLKKEENSYEEKFMVSVDGEEAGSICIQVPEKELELEQKEEPRQEILTEEESRRQKLLETVTKYNEEKEDADYYYLPSRWNGKYLEWSSPKNNSGTLFSALFMIAALALLVVKAREGQAALARRYEELLMDYPGLIMKFTLLIQAGMTARRAFQKIAVDYKRKKPAKPRIAYEEVVTACYEMDSGVSETEAYRRFGERCGQVKYKTFATLLIQNLQKGSRHLADLLEKESMEAWDDRKRKARVLGEAATTKLLVPMVLMLVVVMAIIMIPACLSFYG